MQLKQAQKLPLALYHFWPGLENFADYPGDPDRIPVRKNDSKVGCQHNPVDIARYGLWRLKKFQHNIDCKTMWLTHRIWKKFKFLLFQK